MILDTFFQKFDLFADVPGAVGKMRELVLRLAFSGGLSAVGTDVDGIPLGWKKQTIQSIAASIGPGFACSRTHQMDEGHVHLRTHNISILGTLNFDLLVRIDPKMVDNQKASLKTGDILFNNTNSQELVGKTSLVDRDYDYGFSNHITRIRLKEGILPSFVVYYLTMLRNSGYFARICTRWINQAAVNTETIAEQYIALPPLAEQKQIVAKVDELMALCHCLDAQQQERDTRHAALARAALTRFAEASTPANLQYLFHESSTISPTDLRKSILTLAIQGKLVPQVAIDEPATLLLKRIEGHKLFLVKEGKLRASAVASQIPKNDTDYDLPATWVWVRFGEIMINRDGERIPVSKEERKTRSKVYDYYGASGIIDKIDDFLFDKPLLLIGEDGANLVNRSTPIAYMARGKYWVNNHAHVLDGISEDFLRFIALHINAISLEPYLTGSAQPKMNQAKMNSIPIGLPPLAEQRRIVARVDQLMALVDRLETDLAAARAQGTALLDALVTELSPSTTSTREPLPAVADRVKLKTSDYFTLLIPAVMETFKRPVELHRLLSTVALLFVPDQLLPLIENVGGTAARKHFASFAPANDPGAFITAIQTLAHIGTLTHSEVDETTFLHLNSAKIPPIDPVTRIDARYLASVIDLIPPTDVKPTLSTPELKRAREALSQSVLDLFRS